MSKIRLEDRCMFPYFYTVEDFVKKFGYTPTYDPNKPAKRWLDESAATLKNPYEIKQYPAIVKQGTNYIYDPKGILMTAEAAWSVNIPDGVQKASLNLPFTEWPIPIIFNPDTETIDVGAGTVYINDNKQPAAPAAPLLDDHQMLSSLYTWLKEYLGK